MCCRHAQDEMGADVELHGLGSESEWRPSSPYWQLLRRHFVPLRHGMPGSGKKTALEVPAGTGAGCAGQCEPPPEALGCGGRGGGDRDGGGP